MTKIIRILSYIFLGIGFLIILAGYIGVFMSEGFSGVQRLLNPLNVANFVMTLLMLTPGGLLYYWAERRNKRDFEKDNSETDNSVTEEQYQKGKKVVLQEKKVSTALIQREVSLPYEKALKIIEMLEERDVVGPQDGATPREILE